MSLQGHQIILEPLLSEKSNAATERSNTVCFKVDLRANKHLYFSLKDEKAVVSCAMWASFVRLLRELPREGDLIAVSGQVEHYAPQGKTQLIVRRIEAVGLGPLEQQLRRRMTELRAIGYFDDARKKALPRIPRRMARSSRTGYGSPS